MTPITFTDPEVASLYDALTDTDVNISTVAITATGTVPQYKGKLSGINRAVAVGMVRRGSNLISEKIAATPIAPTTANATTGAQVAAPTVDPKAATAGK